MECAFWLSFGKFASAPIVVIISVIFSGFVIDDFKCCLCLWHCISSCAMLAEYNVIKRPVNSDAYVANEEI